MAESKRGWRQKFAERIWKPHDPGYREKTLHGLGIDVLSDEKLDNRIALLIKLQDVMTERITTDNLEIYVDILKERLTTLNNAIYEIAVPYAASGSNPHYAKMLDGWNTLYSTACSWLLMVEDQLQPEEQTENTEKVPILSLDTGTINNRMLIRYLHDALIKFFFSDGFAVLGKCFRDRDISEKAAIVIQSMMPMQMEMGGRETITASGGRTSEDHMRRPQGGPYPNRMDNKIQG